MPFIVWNDKLSVGVAVIDRDHKKMISIVNDLYDAISVGCGREILGETLDHLVDYMQMHFAREEEFFRLTLYPGTVDHTREHDKMRAWTQEVRSDYDGGSIAGAPLVVMNHLKDWIFDHIIGSDRLFGPHLNAHGIY